MENVKEVFKKVDFNRVNKSDLAMDLFNSLSVGGPSKYSYEVDSILNFTNSRQEILNIVISLIDNTETAKNRYILAMAYTWSYKSFSKQAIHYLKLYLENDIYMETYQNSCHRYTFCEKPHELSKLQRLNIEKKIHVAFMYMGLGQKYQSISMYNDAIVAFERAIYYCPFYAFNWVNLSDCYIKMKDNDKANDILNQARNCKFYNPLTQVNEIGERFVYHEFKDVIDRSLEKL